VTLAGPIEAILEEVSQYRHRRQTTVVAGDGGGLKEGEGGSEAGQVGVRRAAVARRVIPAAADAGNIQKDIHGRVWVQVRTRAAAGVGENPPGVDPQGVDVDADADDGVDRDDVDVDDEDDDVTTQSMEEVDDQRIGGEEGEEAAAAVARGLQSAGVDAVQSTPCPNLAELVRAVVAG
jgi:hypothetical protein